MLGTHGMREREEVSTLIESLTPGKPQRWTVCRGPLAHLAAQRLPPARFPLGRLRASGHAAGGAQRIPVGAAEQLQRGLAGRAIARRRRGRLLERQEAAAERRAAGLYGALPAVIGTLWAREGPVLLGPEAHHARPAETVAAVGAHRFAGRALTQGADGISGARGERQGCGRRRRRRGRGRRGRRRAEDRPLSKADEPPLTTQTQTAPTPGTRARGGVLAALRSDVQVLAAARSSIQVLAAVRSHFRLIALPTFEQLSSLPP